MIKLFKTIILIVWLICLKISGFAQCPTTTYPLCFGESYTLTTQTGLTNIQWQLDSGAGYINITGATNSVYTASSIGKYKYTAKDANGCAIELCCPFNIILGSCPCPISSYSMCNGESYTITAQIGVTNIQWQVDNGSGYADITGATNANYIVTSSGTYKYIGTDANGCAIELCCPYTITVNPLPSFTITKPAICPGNSENIIIGGLLNAATATSTVSIDGGAYGAYPGGGTISGLTVGSHTIALKNSNGCITQKSVAINAIVPNTCIPIVVTKN